MKTKKTSEVRSKRTYPMMLCFNLLCEFDKEFIPHDRRQIFCCKQCRINWHNDKQAEENAVRYADEKVLRAIEKILEKLYHRYVVGSYCMVRKDYFAHEEIDIIHYVVKKGLNPLTGSEISWFYGYGVTRDVKHTDYYLILKKAAI